MTTVVEMTRIEAALRNAEDAACEALKCQAAYEASISDDASYVASLKKRSDDWLATAAKAINSVTREDDPFEIDSPYAVLSLAASIREGVI